MADYVKKPQVFLKRGMNVTLPSDRLGQEYFQFTQNVRCYRLGEWRQRPGMSSLGSVVNSVYHLVRLNNNQNGTFRRFVGTSAGSVYVDDVTHTSFSVADTGYDGFKYSSIISRPDRSPTPYLFIGSSLRNGKFSTTGVRTEWGLAAPLEPPVANPQGIDYVLVNSGNSTTGFTTSVGATTVSQILDFVYIDELIFDSGAAPDMANVALNQVAGGGATAIANLRAGLIIFVKDDTFPSSTIFDTTIVQQVFAPIADTSIQAIAYDSGSSGNCVIQLLSPTPNLERNSIVLLNNGVTSERVVVQSVTIGLDGIPSFRCSTIATYTIGNTVTGVLSYRAYHNIFTFVLNDTYIASEVINWSSVTQGTQTLTYTAALNLASATIMDGGLPVPRPIQEDDVFHCIIQSNASEFTELQLQFSLDSGAFTSDYYYIAVRPPDIQGSINQTQTSISALQLDVQRQQLEAFVTRQNELAQDGFTQDELRELGDLARNFSDNTFNRDIPMESDQGSLAIQVQSGFIQYSSIIVPISQFVRVGNTNRDWKNVTAFRFSIQSTATPLTTYQIGSVWIGGTHGTNNPELIPYTYVYRARNTSTGGRSNPSPPTRYGLKSRRQLINVTIPPYPDSQADVIDVYRTGGILSDYYLVGSVPNTSSTFQDTIPDSIAIRSPILERNRFKPWISSDNPKSGTCDVIGTTILRSTGDLFNTQWVRGTIIKINDKFYSFYTNPASTNFVQINESAGYQTGVSWQIFEPVLDSQSFPAVFGPYSGSSAEFNFAVGDPRNPGYLYWTNGNDVESTSDVNALEICQPSERLMNGCVLDGMVFVFSDKASWRVLPSFEGGQTGAGAIFYPQKTAMGKGLCSQWGLAVGDQIYFVSYDGIYASRGDAVQSITDDSLAPIFRRDISELILALPIAAISFDPADADDISLAYSLDGLYFTYKGIDSLRYTLYFSFLTQGWTLDSVSGSEIIRTNREVQSPQEDQIVVGMSNGQVLIKNSSLFLDNGQPITCTVFDREEIWDSLRGTKQVGDTMIDADPQNATITPSMHYDNDSSNDVLTTLVGTGRTQYVRDINSGLGRVVRGAALKLTWSDGGLGAPRVYAWEPAALIKPEESVNKASDWDNGGYTGTKWLQGFRLRGDTEGLAKSFEVQQDGGTTVEGFTFTANGEQVQTFWLTNPVVAHEMRIVGTDGDLWRNMGIEWIFEPEPEMAAVWETQVTSFDLPFYMHIRELMIAHRSTTDITMNVITDGVTNSYTIPNGGGQRVRSYLPVQAIKAKYHKFRFTSSEPFGLWISDIECRVGPWGRTGAYTTQRPFGDISRTNGGARI